MKYENRDVIIFYETQANNFKVVELLQKWTRIANDGSIYIKAEWKDDFADHGFVITEKGRDSTRKFVFEIGERSNNE